MTSLPGILVFLRAPEPGKVKTRLAKHLGNRRTLALYRQFVSDTLDALAVLNIPTTICFYPPEAKSKVSGWLGPGYEYRPQNGNDLGQRMARAFIQAFHSGLARVVLMGTDIPDLPGRIVQKALDTLQEAPAVIGPSTDGGYYLIGFNTKGFLPDIFNNIPWGTSETLSRTLAVFNQNNAPVHQLPVWHDIDEYDDLIAFLERNTGRKNAAQIKKIIG